MNSFTIDRRPRSRVLRLWLLAGLGMGVFACGGEAPRDDAELEERYGRRDAAADTGAVDTLAIEPTGPAAVRTSTDARGDSSPGPAAGTPLPDSQAPAGRTDAPDDPVEATDTRSDVDPADDPPAGPPRQEVPAGEVDPTWLLARADEAYEGLSSLQASFRQVVEIALLGRRREGTGTWYQKGRDLFRMDFAEPPDDEIVADGTYLWLYTPSDTPGQVIRTTIEGSQTEADALATLLAEARSRYEAEYAGRETVGGVDTHRVRLEPGAGARYREVELWIGVGDHLVRRFRIVEENESVRTVTLTGLRPGAAIRDDVFRFAPPEGVEVFSG